MDVVSLVLATGFVGKSCHLAIGACLHLLEACYKAKVVLGRDPLGLLPLILPGLGANSLERSHFLPVVLMF